MKPWLLFILIGLAGSVTPALAQGGAPMLTNDTGTAGAKHWLIDIAYTDQRAYSGIQQEQFPQVEFDYGLTDRFQVDYAISWIVDHESGQPNRSAFGNSQLGIKWRFYDNATSGLSLSATPQLQFHALRSNPQREELDGGTTFVLPVEIQGRIGPLDWGAELGRTFVSHGDGLWFYGLVLGRPVNARLDLALELYATAQGSIENDVLTTNLGARWQLTEHYALQVAIGRGVNKAHGGELAFTGYLGVELTY